MPMFLPMSASTRPNVSVIIVNYNGLIWLPACLKSLREQTYPPFEVIFVDNCSRDGSVAFVQRTYPEVRLIQNSSNLGFATGNNQGVAAARGQYILLLNTDTRLTPTSLQNMLGAWRTIPRLGCLQPKLIFMHEEDKLDSCGSYFTSTGFLQHIGNQQNTNDPQYAQPFPVLSVKGACLMFPRALLPKTDGLFDESFWCYFEETDFCWRVWLSGYECWYYPPAIVYHAMGGTSGHHLSLETLHYHSLKNRLVTFTKNLSAPIALKTIALHVASNIFLSTFLLLTLRPRLALALWHALGHYAHHLNLILQKRVTVQKKVRTVTDAAWLPPLTRSISHKEMARQVHGFLTYEQNKRQPVTK